MLRISAIGKPAPGNPRRSSPVWTSGHHVVDGLCPVPQSPSVLEAESGRSNDNDEINVLTGGDYYGWPTSAGTVHPPAAVLPVDGRSPGGCAVMDGTLYVTTLDGRALLSSRLSGAGAALRPGKFAPELKGKYGRLRTVVAADDGALWLTTSNRDGQGTPVADDERVIRYVPSSTGGGKNPA